MTYIWDRKADDQGNKDYERLRKLTSPDAKFGEDHEVNAVFTALCKIYYDVFNNVGWNLDTALSDSCEVVEC